MRQGHLRIRHNRRTLAYPTRHWPFSRSNGLHGRLPEIKNNKPSGGLWLIRSGVWGRTWPWSLQYGSIKFKWEMSFSVTKIWFPRLGKEYEKWMQKQGWIGKKKNGIALGMTWMAWSVIQEQQKEEIRGMIKEWFSAEPGTSAMFQHYQLMLSEVMKGLSPGEIQIAKSTATAWNLQGAMTEAKAQQVFLIESSTTCWKSYRFAMRGVASAMRQFSREMWKRGGIQMVILSGFKDEKGEVFSNQ